MTRHFVLVLALITLGRGSAAAAVITADVCIYGGEGVIMKATWNGAAPRNQLAAHLIGAAVQSAHPAVPSTRPQHWFIRFKNTMSEQEFVIQAQ